MAEAALTSRHPEACMQRAPSFDFCLDLTPDDDSCTPCIYPSDRIPGKASHEHATDAEWHAMVGQIPQAVGEAYSDSEGEGSAGTGPELFREEGEGRPQGPDVPEGAVAGVVVVQPDGSPCIGWLMAHPAIVCTPPMHEEWGHGRGLCKPPPIIVHPQTVIVSHCTYLCIHVSN